MGALAALAGTMVLVGTLVAPAVAEVVRGTPQADRLAGAKKSDRLIGRAGADRLSGKQGNDEIRGGADGDKLIGGVGYDQMYGDSGDDLIRARDGQADLVECGDGFDRAVVDLEEDGVYDCEELIEP